MKPQNFSQAQNFGSRKSRDFLGNKKALELQFSWLFAIIVGAVILFLAIYFVVKIIGTGGRVQETETAKRLSILLDPLETGPGESKFTTITFASDTKIYNKCQSTGNFGNNKISTASKRFGKYSKPGEEIAIQNKYIFSEKEIEGKLFNLFSLSYDVGFKVSNLIIVYSKKYCFVNAPNAIEDEIKGTGLKNVNFTNSVENCKGVSVCFNDGNCEINIEGSCMINCGSFGKFETGYVKKKNEKLYYTGSLLYATIFSEPEIYECNLKRLMLRVSNLASLYKEKSEFIASKCNSGLEDDLDALIASASLLKSSKDIFNVQDAAENLEKANQNAVCNLF